MTVKAVPTCPSCGNTDDLYDCASPPDEIHDGVRIVRKRYQCPCMRVWIERQEFPIGEAQGRRPKAEGERPKAKVRKKKN